MDALFHVRNILAIQKNRSPLQELRAKAFARAGLSARLRPWSGLFERFDEPGTTLMLIPTTARILKGIAGGLAVAIATLVIPYFRHWGGAPFSHPDADIVFSYQALLLGDGAAQGDTAHHGYIYFLLLSACYRLAFIVGAVPVYSLTALRGWPDQIAAFVDLVNVGRLFSLAIGLGFSTIFFLTVWRITHSWVVGLLIGTMFAVGQGLSAQTIVLRTELLATFFLWLTFAALCLAGRASGWKTYLLLGLAGLAASLSYNTKVHVIFSLLALPALAVAFGSSCRASGTTAGESSAVKRYGLCAILLLLAAPGWIALLSKVGKMGPFSFAYIPIIMAYCMLCMIVYGRCFRVGVHETRIGAVFICFGFGAGLLLLFIRPHPALFTIDANPIEHMALFLTQKDVATPDPNQLGSAAAGILSAISKHIFAEWFGGGPLTSPYRLLFWITTGGAVILAVYRRWAATLQILLLVALTSLLVGINAIRYGATSAVYAIFVDPWILLATGVTLAQLWSVVVSPAGRTVLGGVAAVVAAIMIKYNITAGLVDSSDSRQQICIQANGYLAKDIAAAFQPLCQ